jgi:hypothetical protein
MSIDVNFWVKIPSAIHQEKTVIKFYNFKIDVFFYWETFGVKSKWIDRNWYFSNITNFLMINQEKWPEVVNYTEELLCFETNFLPNFY